MATATGASLIYNSARLKTLNAAFYHMLSKIFYGLCLPNLLWTAPFCEVSCCSVFCDFLQLARKHNCNQRQMPSACTALSEMCAWVVVHRHTFFLDSGSCGNCTQFIKIHNPDLFTQRDHTTYIIPILCIASNEIHTRVHVLMTLVQCR